MMSIDILMHKEEINMKKYRVYVTETYINHAHLDVVANNEEEAWEIAEDINWNKYTKDYSEDTIREFENLILIKED